MNATASTYTLSEMSRFPLKYIREIIEQKHQNAAEARHREFTEAISLLRVSLPDDEGTRRSLETLAHIGDAYYAELSKAGGRELSGQAVGTEVLSGESQELPPAV